MERFFTDITSDSTGGSELVDITKIELDPALPRDERIRSYLQQIINPYLYLHDGIIVELAFSDNGVTVEDRLEEYIRWRQQHRFVSGNNRHGEVT